MEDVKNKLIKENNGVAWNMFVDGSNNQSGSGVGIVLISPEGAQIEQSIWLNFNTSNNEEKYEALIAGLQRASLLQAKEINIFSNSQLVVNQVNKDSTTKGPNL